MTAQRSSGVWPAAVNAALLGTDRVPLAVSPTDDALGVACARLVANTTDSAATLLRVAAAASAYRRGGSVPARSDEPPIPSAPPETLPLCSDAAAVLLRRMLGGEHDQLLRAWLDLALEHRVRAPADTLRDLLDRAVRDQRLRERVRSAGGERVAWLARFNANWGFAATVGDSRDALVRIWETGTPPQRLEALLQLRQTDAAGAREVLEKTWAQETADDRPYFIAALDHGLSTADEPFLERALDDKRKEVRQRAAELLVRLPTSALVARMALRATALVSLGRSKILHRPQIDVRLPDEPDAALVRDGLNPKPPNGAGIGEKAWWLAQIIGAVPPSTWVTAWSLDPDAILRAVEGHEWRESLVAGWLTATERVRDETWALALWQRGEVALVDQKWGAPPLNHVFTRAVSPARVDADLGKLITEDRDALRGSHPVLITLLGWQHDWSNALARLVADRLKEYSGARKVSFVGEFGIRALLERCGLAVPASAIGAFFDGWPEGSEVWSTWGTAVDSLLSVLRFRNELHLAFTEASEP